MVDTAKNINQAAILAENEALRKELEKLKQCKRYGLVWEDHPEALDKKNIIPLLAKDDGLSLPVIADKKQNYLIEGDNYHALKALQHTHRSAIDVIYIDPPYNTGNEFVYNDKIVDKEDSFRHSKWLSFMEKRLKLARELMSDDGVIFISIDDNEQAQLKLLCDAVFGPDGFAGMFIRKTRSAVNDKYNNLGTNHEYMVCYTKNEDVKLTGQPKVLDNYKNPDNDPNGNWKTGDPSAKSGSATTYFEIINPITGQVDLPPVGRYWAFNKASFEKYVSNGRIVFRDEQKEGHRGFYFKVYQKDLKSHEMPNNSLMFTTNENINQVATKLLINIDVDFSYPKPVDFIKNVIAMGTKSATVLDFFAGSGTTGHAVMELNKEDGGDRNFILCTNNEVSGDLVRTHFFNEGCITKNNKTEFNKFVKEHPDVHQAFLESETYESLGIARAVTRERIKRVIEGYTTPKGKDVEGLPNNLTYLKTKEFDKKEQYGFDRNLLANLAYNSHILKYPELNYESFQVDAFTDIDEINLTTSKQPVAFVNTRDRESLADIVEQLTSRFGNKVIIETLESYFN